MVVKQHDRRTLSDERRLELIDADIKRAELSARMAYDVLTDARKRRDDLYVERSSLVWHIKPGMRVTKQGKIGIVKTVLPSDHPEQKPALEVQIVKKDGEISSSTQEFETWEFIS